MSWLPAALLAFGAGACLALQAGLNAQLGLRAQSSLLAASVGALSAAFCVALAWLLARSARAAASERQPVRPRALWLVGGALGGVALALIYALVPRVGLDAVVVLALVGQLLTSLLAGHFGWLDLPRARLTPRKLLGALLLMGGATLVTHG